MSFTKCHLISMTSILPNVLVSKHNLCPFCSPEEIRYRVETNTVLWFPSGTHVSRDFQFHMSPNCSRCSQCLALVPWPLPSLMWKIWNLQKAKTWDWWRALWFWLWHSVPSADPGQKSRELAPQQQPPARSSIKTFLKDERLPLHHGTSDSIKLCQLSRMRYWHVLKKQAPRLEWSLGKAEQSWELRV